MVARQSRRPYTLGSVIRAQFIDKKGKAGWFDAKVVREKRGEDGSDSVLVHYVGYGKQSDEWIPIGERLSAMAVGGEDEWGCTPGNDGRRGDGEYAVDFIVARRIKNGNIE